jgi:hypothetical protein
MLFLGDHVVRQDPRAMTRHSDWHVRDIPAVVFTHHQDHEDDTGTSRCQSVSPLKRPPCRVLHSHDTDAASMEGLCCCTGSQRIPLVFGGGKTGGGYTYAPQGQTIQTKPQAHARRVSAGTARVRPPHGGRASWLPVLGWPTIAWNVGFPCHGPEEDDAAQGKG